MAFFLARWPSFFGLAIGAILLRAAATWAEKIDIPFGRAMWIYFVVSICNGVVGFIMGLAFGAAMGKDGQIVASLVNLPIGFCISSGIIGSMLHIGFGKGAKITALMYVTVLAIVVCFAIVALLLVYAFR